MPVHVSIGLPSSSLDGKRMRQQKSLARLGNHPVTTGERSGAIAMFMLAVVFPHLALIVAAIFMF
jgi:hypothetical protein